MNFGFSNPITFGERLKYLMEKDGIDTSEKGAEAILSTKLYKNGIIEYNDRAGDEIAKAKQRDNTRNVISKHLKLDSAENLSGIWILRYCKYFKCSADYLLRGIDLPTHIETNINKETGLSDTAIETIKSIKQESENWVSDWEHRKNIKHSDNSEFNYPGYNDLSALNFMMKYSGILSNILRGLQDLLHNDYKIPVHLENEKFVIPDNSYEYISEQYYLLLARSKQMPDDNVSLLLDESFFHSIALKKIEHSFLELLNLYQENQKEDLK